MPTRHLIHRRPTLHGFTLIELLVVITIVVVLLALLAPALDKAVYEAELTVCGAQQKGIGSGATQYAMDAKRWYPARPDITSLGTPSVLRDAQANNAVIPVDYRPVLMPYIQMKSLVDPLSITVTVDPADTKPLSTVIANVNLWFAWKYRNAQRGSSRVGDRFEWDRTEYSLIVSDLCERNTQGNTSVRGGHPDHGGKLAPLTIQDEDPTGGGSFQRVLSFWIMTRGTDRGPIDKNFTYGDLSVQRFRDVLHADDPRMVEPSTIWNGSPERRDQIPDE